MDNGYSSPPYPSARCAANIYRMVALPVNNPTPEYPEATGLGCNPNARCGNGLEKIYPSCAVRYGYMGYIGEFRYAPGMLFGCGGKVVIQTPRGTEIGEQKSLTCSGCDKSISRQQIMKYVKNSGPEFYRLKAGRILRLATAQDLLEQGKLNMEAAQELKRAKELVREMNLPMRMIACEHLLGGERVIYHFMSEDRVDFRELVRRIAQEYHTRVEMHQVGARDEARLIADYEICGRECCCKNFLKKLRPVNMRMAKLQKATLDPSKVSGRCGRLRCCLRYEHEGYESLDKSLPRGGSRVRTAKGLATVTDRQVLTQLLTLAYDDGGKFETVAVEEVLERNLPRLERPPQAFQPDRGGRDSGPPLRDGGPHNRDRGNRPPHGQFRPGQGQPPPRREPQMRDVGGPAQFSPMDESPNPLPPADETNLPMSDDLPLDTQADEVDDFAAGLADDTPPANRPPPSGPPQQGGPPRQGGPQGQGGDQQRHRRGRRGRNRGRGGPGGPGRDQGPRGGNSGQGPVG